MRAVVPGVVHLFILPLLMGVTPALNGPVLSLLLVPIQLQQLQVSCPYSHGQWPGKGQWPVQTEKKVFSRSFYRNSPFLIGQNPVAGEQLASLNARKMCIWHFRPLWGEVDSICKERREEKQLSGRKPLGVSLASEGFEQTRDVIRFAVSFLFPQVFLLLPCHCPLPPFSTLKHHTSTQFPIFFSHNKLTLQHL